MARSESGPPPSEPCVASAVVGREAHCTVVRLGGEHDIATTSLVTKALGRAARVGDGDVVVDLSEIRFMSAATLGCILRVRRILGGQGRTLTLQSPSPSARRLLDLCLVNGTVQIPPAQVSMLAIEAVERRDSDLARHDRGGVPRSHAGTRAMGRTAAGGSWPAAHPPAGGSASP